MRKDLCAQAQLILCAGFWILDLKRINLFFWPASGIQHPASRPLGTIIRVQDGAIFVFSG
jgi:hypothetical protein